MLKSLVFGKVYFMTEHTTINTKLNFLMQIPGLWACKDIHSIFTHLSHEYSQIIGLKHPEDQIGKSDTDLPCELMLCADTFRTQDQKVIQTGKTLKILDIHPLPEVGWCVWMTTKTPLFDEHKKIVGSIFHSLNITQSHMIELASLLEQINSPQQKLRQKSYEIGDLNPPIKLTKRESQVLFFLIRGKCLKRIALIFNLSHRTIEDYIENLRIKFDAQNKFDLIDKAIHYGYLNFIPEALFRKQLSIELGEK